MDDETEGCGEGALGFLGALKGHWRGGGGGGEIGEGVDVLRAAGGGLGSQEREGVEEVHEDEAEDEGDAYPGVRRTGWLGGVRYGRLLRIC